MIETIEDYITVEKERVREEGREEGLEEGLEKGVNSIMDSLLKNKIIDTEKILAVLDDNEEVKKIVEKAIQSAMR